MSAGLQKFETQWKTTLAGSYRGCFRNAMWYICRFLVKVAIKRVAIVRSLAA